MRSLAILCSFNLPSLQCFTVITFMIGCPCNTSLVRNENLLRMCTNALGMILKIKLIDLSKLEKTIIISQCKVHYVADDLGI